MFSCRKKSRKTGFILFLLLVTPFLYGQSVSFKNYSLDDGLPSNQIHCSFQHDDGFMLFGTDVGLVSFNGNTFKTIPFTHSKKSNSTIFKIGKGANGRVYINTYRNGLFFLDGDSVRPYIFNDKLLKICGQSFIDNLIITKNGDLYFTLFTRIDYRVYQIDSNGIQSVTQPENIYTKHSHSPRKFLFIREDSLAISKSTGVQKYKVERYENHPEIFNVEHNNNTNLKVDKSKFHFLKIPENEFGYDSLSGQPEFSILYNKFWWVTSHSKLALFDEDFTFISIHDFGFKIEHILPFENGSIIVCHGNGAAVLKWNKTNFEIEPIINNELISSGYLDNDGGIWLTSTKNGLYYTPSLKIKSLTSPTFLNTDILIVKTNPSEFVIANRKGDFGFYSFPDLDLRYNWDTVRPTHSFVLVEGFLGMATMQMTFDGTSMVTKDYLMTRANGVYHYPNSDSILLATPRDGIHLTQKGVPKTFSNTAKYRYNLNTYAVHILDEIIYVGTDNGIQIFSLAEIKYTPYLPNLINSRIIDLKSIGHKLIAVSNNGIHICENDSVIHLTTKDGLVTNICRKIEVENDSVFWVANKLGLNKIIYNQKTGKYRILTFTKDCGLSSNSINDISIEGDNIFIATSKGLCYTKIENLKVDTSPIRFELDFPFLEIDNFDFSDTLVLPQEKRDIYLLIKEMSFRHNENLGYSFALNKDQTVLSSTNSISFGNLKSGYNSITINMSSGNNNWNSKPIILNIWASPFFYERLWFKTTASLLLLILLILALFLAFRIRDKRRRQQLEMAVANQEATVSKYNALSLQLSPHFIFNSLNNIQYLSVSKNYVAVNQFVANLARLTRKILEHSKLQLIPLETELENLKLYLEIEQIRFEHKPIEIKFEIDPNLDLKGLFIPPMIIQPSVENAIWHGLLIKEGHRKLEIIFKALEYGFEIHIRDNGIGLNAKQQGGIRIKGQTSIGVKNTRDRIQLYSEMDMGNAEFSLEELKLDDKILGTLASFKFTPAKLK